MNHLLSGTIICKNEEKNITKAINSLLPYCEQIVVVDTGSSDSTPAICSRLGCEVYYFKWIDDFSAARNFALQHCRNPWIISLDADEILLPFDFETFRTYFENSQMGGINVQIQNILNDEQTSTTHRYTRIFRKHINIRYVGKIHEQISEAIESLGFLIVQSNIKILHSGYSKIDTNKFERNKQLLNEELAEKPTDHWLKYHLAETEFSLGNLEKSFALYNEINNSRTLSVQQNEMVKIRLAQIYLTNNETEQIIKILDFQSMDTNIEGLRKFVLAAAYLELHNFEKALSLYKSEEVLNSEAVNKQLVQSAIRLIESSIYK